MTIQSEIILNKKLNGDVGITQNSVEVFSSINASAVVNTLYLKEGMVGIGVVPTTKLHVQVANTINKQALLIEQLDTTNNPICAEINNDGTNHGLYIHQDGVLAASKYSLYVYSNAIQNASPLAYFLQDNASSNQDLLVLKQDGTGNALNITAGKLKLPSGGAINEFSTDGTLAGNSDDAVPTEKAVRTYVTGGSGVKAYVAASTYREITADTERSVALGSGSAWTRIKELSPMIRPGTIYVKYAGYATPDGIGEIQLWINGAAVGTINNLTWSYQTFTESSITVAAGDVVQVYVRATTYARNIYVKRLWVYVSNPTLPVEVSDY